MVNEDVLLTLLDLLKAKIDITWSDSATDSKLKEFIESSIAWFVEKTGYVEFNYLQASTERELILTRVQYARENMLDDFSKNYKSEIVAMINRAKVRKYNASTQNADTNTSI